MKRNSLERKLIKGGKNEKEKREKTEYAQQNRPQERRGRGKKEQKKGVKNNKDIRLRYACCAFQIV